MKLDWDDLRLFLEVARAAGLAPAAERTGKSAATLGRRLLSLEEALGQELVHRHARGYELTAHGKALMARIETIEAEISQATQRDYGKAKPLVKLSAGTWMARYLATHVQKIVRPDDHLRLRFVSAEEKLDIGHRETVIGIRNQRPTEVSIAAQKVARIHFAVYGAHTDITGWIGLNVETPSARWVKANHSEDIMVEANTPTLALDLARAGSGHIVLPELIGDNEPGLHRLSGTIDELSHDQWLVSHHDDRNAPHVRTVLNRVRKLIST